MPSRLATILWVVSILGLFGFVWVAPLLAHPEMTKVASGAICNSTDAPSEGASPHGDDASGPGCGWLLPARNSDQPSNRTPGLPAKESSGTGCDSRLDSNRCWVAAIYGLAAETHVSAPANTTLSAFHEEAPEAEATRGTSALARIFRSFTGGNFRHNLTKLTGVAPKGAQAHHVFPQKFEATFRRAGIDIHSPYHGSWWEAGAHQRAAGAYNQAFDDFLTANPGATGSQLLDFGRGLAQRYGLDVFF